MLSVSGARGIVGASMTPEVARAFALAFGAHLRENTAGGGGTTVIGRDGRGSGAELGAAAGEGLAAAGFDVIDLGIVATPTVGLMIGLLGAAGGIAVTASHNPIEWNGLKTLNADGLALPAEQAAQVIERFRAGDAGAGTRIGRIGSRADGDELHVSRVLALVDVERIRRAGFRVVLDSVNASGARAGRMLLDALGCEVVHLNAERTGKFAHTPEPLEANLGDLMRAVRERPGTAVGFAQDPDADRLALVDDTGRFIGEEYTFVLGAMRLLEREGGGSIATNLSTSRMIDEVVARFPGSRVVRTAVGEANVVAGIRGGSCIAGGEGNGGLIWPNVCWVRDSLSAMALVLESLAVARTSLAALAATIPRFSMVKRKMELAAIGGQEAIAPALESVRAHFGAVPGARINAADGIRIDLERGWVHLRASNTEPIIRVIAESGSTEAAEALCDECASAAELPTGGSRSVSP